MWMNLIRRLGFAAAIGAASDALAISIDRDGSDLWIRDGVLDDAAVERIDDALRRRPGIDAIHLKDLRGGRPIRTRLALHAALVFRRVEVHGLCEAACAHLALTARSTGLHPQATLILQDPPAFIDWEGLEMTRFKDVEWLSVRLPTLPRAVIERVLLARWPRVPQLILRPRRPSTDLIDVSFCDPSPDRCLLLAPIGPGASSLTPLPGTFPDRR